MPCNHLILCDPLLPPSIISSIRVFSSESLLGIRWPKYWSFNISPSNEHPGLISFRMDWLDLLAVQGILESSPAPQFKSINSLVLSFLYSPTLTAIYDHWKNHSLDVSFIKISSFLDNMTISSVQFSHSVVSNSLWPPCSAAHQASLSITNSWSLLKLMFFVSGMPFSHLILCRSLLLLPSIFPSIRVFSIGYSYAVKGLPWWPSHKKSACNVGASGDAGSITGLGRSPGRGHDTHPSVLA